MQTLIFCDNVLKLLTCTNYLSKLKNISKNIGIVVSNMDTNKLLLSHTNIFSNIYEIDELTLGDLLNSKHKNHSAIINHLLAKSEEIQDNNWNYVISLTKNKVMLSLYSFYVSDMNLKKHGICLNEKLISYPTSDKYSLTSFCRNNLFQLHISDDFLLSKELEKNFNNFDSQPETNLLNENFNVNKISTNSIEFINNTFNNNKKLLYFSFSESFYKSSINIATLHETIEKISLQECNIIFPIKKGESRQRHFISKLKNTNIIECECNINDKINLLKLCDAAYTNEEMIKTFCSKYVKKPILYISKNISLNDVINENEYENIIVSNESKDINKFSNEVSGIINLIVDNKHIGKVNNLYSCDSQNSGYIYTQKLVQKRFFGYTKGHIPSKLIEIETEAIKSYMSTILKSIKILKYAKSNNQSVNVVEIFEVLLTNQNCKYGQITSILLDNQISSLGIMTKQDSLNILENSLFDIKSKIQNSLKYLNKEKMDNYERTA